MGMGGNGKPPQWEWELPALTWKFIPKLLVLSVCAYSDNDSTVVCEMKTRGLNLKYEAEPDRERF